MTQEEVKMRAELYSALAEDKTIQVKNNGTWEDVKIEGLNKIYDYNNYRIKPESKYRPFKTQEECWNEMLKHQPIGYIKGKVQKNVVFITEISTNTHNELSFSLSISTSVYDAECLFSSYTFADGTPFGIQED